MSDFYLHHEFSIAAVQLALAMLGMGCLLRHSDFIDVFRRPRGFLTGLAAQLVAVPLIALAIGAVPAVSAGVATGLILLAAVPGGTFSNIITYAARGTIALSIALTSVTTVAALATTPLILRTLAANALPPDFAMPTQRIAFDIALCLLAPLACGMALGHRLPLWRKAMARYAIRASIAVILVMIVGATSAGRIDPVEQGGSALAAIFAFCVAAQVFAVIAARAAALPTKDLAAIAIEVTVRNANLALLVKASVFPVAAGVADPLADGVLYALLMYGGIALPVVLPLVVIHRRRSASANQRNPQA